MRWCGAAWFVLNHPEQKIKVKLVLERVTGIDLDDAREERDRDSEQLCFCSGPVSSMSICTRACGVDKELTFV